MEHVVQQLYAVDHDLSLAADRDPVVPAITQGQVPDGDFAVVVGLDAVAAHVLAPDVRVRGDDLAVGDGHVAAHIERRASEGDPDRAVLRRAALDPHVVGRGRIGMPFDLDSVLVAIGVAVPHCHPV